MPGTELLGRDTGRTRAGTNETESEQYIQNTNTTDGTSKRRMKNDVNKRRKVVEKEILFPEDRPREIEKQGPHFEANNDQQRAEDTVHS